ncbi:photosystem II reaction center PSB28 protein, chloroplastic [Elaeis guineensis]|uniref:photosystem II reaction center PSB28 protein, chloroplastic n=1 Tax=Elaeis guineensis var. tenera TaxID=51953 RepID=UPI003C6D6A72
MALFATHRSPIVSFSPCSTNPLPRPVIFLCFLLSVSLSSHRLDTRMAAMRSLALSSSICKLPHHHHSLAGLASLSSVPCQGIHSTFNGTSLQLPPPKRAQKGGSSHLISPVTMMVKPAIQFIQGTDEQTIPDVRLTKSRDGTNGVATFIFEQPSVFDSSSELGDITGFYMIDEEGVLQSVDVSAKFINGKPARIEAKYIMRNPREWERFMRFMERYSQANGLQFIKK